MDYEKAYNDAMARLELVVRTGMKLDPAYIFPELADSEDERMRDALIYGLQKYGDDYKVKTFAGWPIDGLIAYLEKQKEPHIPWYDLQKSKEAGYTILKTEEYEELIKQKEQKPVMIQWTGENLKEVIDFTGKSPKFDEYFKSWEDFEKYVHSHDDIFKLFCEDGSHYEVPIGAWIVKTPDGYNIPSRFKFVQKPAEWSDEDEEMIDSINRSIGSYMAHIRTECAILTDKDKKRILDRCENECAWLEDRLKHFRPQPKQEWSEEDRSIMDGIQLVLESWDRTHSSIAGLPSLIPSYISWLKSLRPQWKPSEQEKGALRTAIHILTDERSFPKAAAQLQNILNAFEGKESRKDWKPSEEQMEVFSELLGAVPREPELYELYEQLQKLM